MNKKAFLKRIEYKYSQEIKIKVIADVHYGHTLCDIKAFKNYLADSDENTYFLGIGDLCDSICVTDPRYRKSIDAIASEEILDEQIQGMYNMLLPYKEKIILCGIGNHEDVITKRCGTNPIKRLCSMLEIPYAGYSYFLKLQLHENGSRVRTIMFKCHHGYGGGSRTQGNNITKFAKDMSFYDADVFVYGHVHSLQHDVVPRLSIVGDKLVAKPKILAICGTWKKSLTEDNTTSWEEVQGFPPVMIGGLNINIRPTGTWCDIKVTL